MQLFFQVLSLVGWGEFYQLASHEKIQFHLLV
jgi:hypothetical protein